MIKPLKKVKVLENAERVVWMFPKLGLIGLRLNVKKGDMKWLYTYRPDDFVSGGLELGDATELKTGTIVTPGGKIRLHNSSLSTPTEFEGGTYRVAHGIHIAGDVHVEGVEDSLVICTGPRENMRGFDNKDLTWVNLDDKETHTFGPMDIGFVVIWDNSEEFHAFEVEEGDVFTADGESIIGVVSLKEEDNDDSA